MMAADFMNLSRPVYDTDAIYGNTPTVESSGEITEPYHYMTYSDLQQAAPATVRGYIDYIRRVYGVSNSILAATCGTHRCNIIRILQRAGVPALTQVEGCEIRSHYNRDAWAEFVSGKRRNNSEKELSESNTILISGLTDGQLVGLLVLLEPHKNVNVKFCKKGVDRHE